MLLIFKNFKQTKIINLIPNLALFFIASERLVLALLASLFDLKQNSKMAMNMATTNNAAREKIYYYFYILVKQSLFFREINIVPKKKNTPTTLARDKSPLT